MSVDIRVDKGTSWASSISHTLSRHTCARRSVGCARLHTGRLAEWPGVACLEARAWERGRTGQARLRGRYGECRLSQPVGWCRQRAGPSPESWCWGGAWGPPPQESMWQTFAHSLSCLLSLPFRKPEVLAPEQVAASPGRSVKTQTPGPHLAFQIQPSGAAWESAFLVLMPWAQDPHPRSV